MRLCDLFQENVFEMTAFKELELAFRNLPLQIIQKFVGKDKER